jgi:LPS-assembly lipoprotein
MSLFSRRSVVLLPLALAACVPVGSAAGLQGRIRIANPTTKNAFDLVSRLEERLGRGTAARFDLTYTINTRSVGVGVTPENVINRFHLTGTVDWSLISRETGAQVTGGQVGNYVAYSATDSTVAGLTAEEDAAFRLMQKLADQIVTHLIVTEGSWA